MKLFYNVEKKLLIVTRKYLEVIVGTMNTIDSVDTWELQVVEFPYTTAIVNDQAEGVNVRVGTDRYSQAFFEIKPDYSDFAGLPMSFRYPCGYINIEKGPTKVAEKVLSFMQEYRERTEISRASRAHAMLRVDAQRSLRNEFEALLAAPNRHYGDWMNLQLAYNAETHDNPNIGVSTYTGDTVGGDFYGHVSIMFSKLPPSLARRLIKLVLVELGHYDNGMSVQDDDALRDAINISKL